MRGPSRKSVEYHQSRPDPGCLLYFQLRMAATAISNDRDPKAIIPPKCGIWRSVFSITTFYIGTTTDRGRLTLQPMKVEMVNIAVVQPSS